MWPRAVRPRRCSMLRPLSRAHRPPAPWVVVAVALLLSLVSRTGRPAGPVSAQVAQLISSFECSPNPARVDVRVICVVRVTSDAVDLTVQFGHGPNVDESPAVLEI